MVEKKSNVQSRRSCTNKTSNIGDENNIVENRNYVVTLAVSVSLVCFLIIAGVIWVGFYIKKKKNEYESDDLNIQ